MSYQRIEYEFTPANNDAAEAMTACISALYGVNPDKAKVRLLNARLLMTYLPSLKPEAQERAGRSIVNLLRVQP